MPPLRLPRPAILLVACMAPLAGCGGGEAEGGALRVAYLAPDSPAAAAAARQGLDLALSELNAEEGARPVELAAARSADCAALAAGDPVDAVVGHLAGDALATCLAALGAAEIPYLSAARLPADVCHASFHQVAPTPNQLAEAAAALAADEGARRFHLLGSDDAFTRALFVSLAALADSGGASIAGTTHLPADGAPGDALAAVAASGADLVVLSVGPERAAPFLSELRGDARTRGVRLMTLDAGEGEARAAGASADGVLAVSDYFEAIQQPANLEFVRALRAAHGDGARPSAAAAAAYDALTMIASAARSGEGGEAAPLAGRIAAADHVGPRGPVAFSGGARGYPRLSLYLGRMRADGTVELVTFRPNVEPRASCG